MKNSIFIYLFIVLMLGQIYCIEFFHPDLKKVKIKYFVDGQITDGEILVFFSASTLQTKRIFVRNVENFDKLMPSFSDIGAPGYPFDYFIETDDGEILGVMDYCVLCNCEIGTTIKPKFWPW